MMHEQAKEKHVRAAFIAASVALFAAAGAGAQPPPSSLALLRVHASLEEFHQGNVFVDEDLFVLRDGSITGSVAVQLEATCIGCGWNSGIGHGIGTAQQFAALQSALAANTVGIQPGNCVVQKPTVESGTYEITWYGIARTQPFARRNVFAFQVNTDGPLCPPAVAKIITAIETYAFQAGVPVSDFWHPNP